MKNLSRNELKKLLGGLANADCPAYNNCNGVSGTVYCCTGSGNVAGTTGSCDCLHQNGCTFVTSSAKYC
jgi:hypothetical protein